MVAGLIAVSGLLLFACNSHPPGGSDDSYDSGGPVGVGLVAPVTSSHQPPGEPRTAPTGPVGPPPGTRPAGTGWPAGIG